MLWLRGTILSCLVFVLVGCSMGKKDKADVSKSVGSEELSPTYHWKRPSGDKPQRSLPPTAEDTDLF